MCTLSAYLKYSFASATLAHSGNIITIMIMIAIIIDIGIGAQLLLPKQFRVHFREVCVRTGEGGYQNVYIA